MQTDLFSRSSPVDTRGLRAVIADTAFNRRFLRVAARKCSILFLDEIEAAVRDALSHDVAVPMIDLSLPSEPTMVLAAVEWPAGTHR